ncbi:MAG TPA: GAF domain-containing protein, partial [Archangium sp.]
MDTPREEAFDRLARLAAEILNVPLTIVSLVDADKQFFKADFGLPSPFRETRELPIDASLCRYTLEGEPIISSNALADPFLRFHPSTGPWGIVAIIVLPLINPDGHVLGTFCCIEPKVREWTPHEIKVMRELTASIMTEINLRGQIAKLKTEQNLRDTFVAALTHDLRTPLTASKLTV